MRPVLQQSPVCSSTLQVLYKAINFHTNALLRHHSNTQVVYKRDHTVEIEPQSESQVLIRRHRSHVSPKASARLACSAKTRDPAHNTTVGPTSTKNSVHIAEKRRSWRSRLSTFDEYEQENSLDGARRDSGYRLLDEEAYSGDWGLWLELLRFQQRHDGDNGVRRIWKKMREKDLRPPIEGPFIQELWARIIQATLQDEDFMKEVMDYASSLQQEKGRTVPKLYTTIMISKLREGALECLEWHTRLRQQCPPRWEDYSELFEQALQSGRLSTFEIIYKSHALRPMYGLIIHKLCSLGLYDQAYRWHFILLESKDLPPDFTAIEPLITHFAQLNDDRGVELITTSTIASGTRIEAPLNRFVRGSETISREIMNRQLGKVHGIVPKQLSDNFCARLFATKLFRVETVINGLEMMAVEGLGPQSLREIVVRDDCDCNAICRHLDLLKEAGIQFGTSKYETLIRQAALGNRRSLLRSIVNCDAHPDTFEDINLQEKMYATYLREANKIQMERILATITCELPEHDLDMQKKNVLLRGYIRLNYRNKVMSLLEEMKVTNIPLTPKTSRHLRVHWLSQRQAGRTGFTGLTLKNLSLIVLVMKQTLESSGSVPIESWREILRRLGMTGNLNQFHLLALWLASWYANPSKAVDSKRGLQKSFDRIAMSKREEHCPTTKMVLHKDLTSSESLAMPKTMAKTALEMSIHSPAPAADMTRHSHYPYSYLDKLFTKSAQRAIIDWGFQQHAKKPPRSVKHSRRKPNSQFDWTWGLLLLRELRDCGVTVDRSLVSKACKRRLATLFGISKPYKIPVNRAARRWNDKRLALGEAAAQYGAYVQQMEAIWGDNLFVSRPESSPKGQEFHGPDRKIDAWRVVNAKEGLEASNL